jgi:preprotein translocase subunit SecD
VVLFMIVYYRLSGVIADLALVLNIVLLLGAMASLNATLTMPGIAGIILAIGMAVDSNVLMFERMRDELKAGKTPRAAVDSGYDKAFWTIFDSHVTTLITAAVLFQFGTGPIKGFAVTLSLGVAINLYTALVGTKTVFDLINSRKEVNSLSI